MELPQEILKQIFQEIYGYRGSYRSQENLSNLYSCLLVNKSWCEAAVPILWSSIFYSNIGAITTYLSCLSTDKLRMIADSGIRLPPSLSQRHLTSFPPMPSEKKTSNGIAKINDNRGSNNNNVMFDYPSFLIELNLDKLLKSVFAWCLKHRNNSHRISKSSLSSSFSSLSSSLSSHIFTSYTHSSTYSSPDSSIISSESSYYPSIQSQKPEDVIRAECVLRSLLQLFSLKNSKIQYFSFNSVPGFLLNDDYFENLKYIDFHGILCEQETRRIFENVKECRLEWDALAVDGLLDAFGSNSINLVKKIFFV